MITLQYVIQRQDLPSIAQHVGEHNTDMLRAIWQRRQRCWRALSRIYTLLAVIFFLFDCLALYIAYRQGNITAESPTIFAITLFLFLLLAALPLLLPPIVIAIFRVLSGRRSEEARFSAFVAGRQKKIIAALSKDLSADAAYYTLYANERALSWFIRGDEKKKEIAWQDYLSSSEDARWLVFIFCVKHKVIPFVLPKTSLLMSSGIYSTRLTQLSALCPDGGPA